MNVIRLPDAAQVGKRAAELLAGRIKELPRAVLALPTGETPKNMYRELGRLSGGGLDFSAVTVFALDEYVGTPREGPFTFAGYMDRHFYSNVNVPPAQRHVFDSVSPDPDEECRRYDRRIEDAGGFDLAVLGIGRNGHIAFNEPGEFLTLGSHVQPLSEETVKRNQSAAAGKIASGTGGGPAADEFPTHAMTVGIDAILNARSILLLATGPTKARAIAEMLGGRITTQLPASLLQIHGDCSVLVDPAAAAELVSSEPG